MLESTSYNWFVAPLCQCDACNVRTSYYFQLVLLFACEETRAGVNLRTIKKNLFFFGNLQRLQKYFASVGSAEDSSVEQTL